VLSLLLSVVLKTIDFKQQMGFKGSFNRKYLRMKDFKKLEVWQRGIKIVELAYKLTKCCPTKKNLI